jgi:hypothetical protein
VISEEIRKRQSVVQKSGEEWENYVKDFTNKKLQELNSKIKIIKGKGIRKNSSLWKKLLIPAGKDGSKKVWGDIDLIAVDENNEPLAVISCKVSLHGRFSETLFYAVALKNLIKNLKFLFATPDKGRQQKSEKWQSEWGSEQNPTKDRLLASYYLDGVYILNPKTKLGGKIKSLEELPKDLINWFGK